MNDKTIGADAADAAEAFRQIRERVGIKQSGLEALPCIETVLETACPALVAILRSNFIKTQIEIYKRGDHEANIQRALFMREVNAANLCLLFAGLLSAVVLVLASGGEAGLLNRLPWLAPLLGLATLALGATGAMFGFMARDQARTARWLARRGEAEIARLAVFRTIATGAAAAGDRDLALHGLAVITTHLLDDQRAWLGGRAADHRRSSERTSLWGGLATGRTSLWGGLATGLAFVGGSGAIILGATPGIAWLVLAGVVGAGLAAFAANREALRRDRANAERYEKAQVVLDKLAGRVDEIVVHVAGGEIQALAVFAETLTDQLAAEHTEWLEGTAQAETVLAKFDAQLAGLSKRDG